MDSSTVRRVLEERKIEDDFFESRKGPNETIRHVQIKLSDDGAFQILFKNRKARFGVHVVLRDHENLGWVECKAIIEAVLVGARGTSISSASFRALMHEMKKKHQEIEEPYFQNKRLVCKIRPDFGNFGLRSANTIVKTGLLFLENGNIMVSSCTSGGYSYRVVIALTSASGVLYMLDCELLTQVISFLEPGDDVDQSNFLMFGLHLRMMYNYVKLTAEEGSDKGMALVVLPSKLRNEEEPDPRFTGALHAEMQGRSQGVSGRGISRLFSHSYHGLLLARIIKEGGQAKIFAGVHKGQNVAVKVFRTEGFYDEAVSSYKTELKMLLRLPKHRNIVEVLDFHEVPHPALVMNHVGGENLMEYLARTGGMDTATGRRTAIGIAEGLCYMHEHGVVHRDMKTSNIMRELDGTPVIIDLGMGSMLSHSSSGRRTEVAQMIMKMALTQTILQTDGVKGTLFWTPPEMMKDQQWSVKTDVYAFGIILWEIFSGKTPFQVEGGADKPPEVHVREILQGKRPDMLAVRHIDDSLKHVMKICWDSDPESRPTMQMVLDMLEGRATVGKTGVARGEGADALDMSEFDEALGMVSSLTGFETFPNHTRRVS